MSGASVEVREVSHRYPGAPTLALDSVSFAAKPGERIGLLGPNGAGKSTLMRLMCGFLPVARAQTLLVDGFDVAVAPQAVRARVGYMPEHVPLHTELRVAEHLRFRAAIKRVPRRGRQAEVERVAAQTGLTARLHQPIAQLSRGFRQRVGIADALLGAPPLLVLDEPTVGLDPNQVIEIRAMLQGLGGLHTLVFSSHILAEVEALCDRVVIVSEGKLVVDESLETCLAAGAIAVRMVASPERALALLETATNGFATCTLAGIDAHTVSYELRFGPRVDAERLLGAIGRQCAEQAIEVRTLALGRTRLEERFAEVTGAQRRT